MAKFSCFAVLIRRSSKKSKGEHGFSDSVQSRKQNGTLHVKLEQHPIEAYVSVLEEKSTCEVKVVDENSPEAEAVDVAYEGSDEHEESSPSIKRDFSDFDLQAHEGADLSLSRKTGTEESTDVETNDQYESRSERDTEMGAQLIPSGHVSDPGIEKAKFWASPTLKRSCSNVETGYMLRKMAIPMGSRGFVDSKNLNDGVSAEGLWGSPTSVTSHFSADRVMLKKHSSSQVLPSRSKRLWWKLFLWSHRNLHKPQVVKQRVSPINHKSDQNGGYCSDTHDLRRANASPEVESPGQFKENGQKWDNFPENQWVAFPGSSSLTRVDEWVNSLDNQVNDEGDESISFPPSPETRGSPARNANRRQNPSNSGELLHANTVIQSLNSSSTVAHIAGMNMKVIPAISHFSSLRSINLSGNFIVRITPGSLPKGLHTLNLSRNKISTIEGLRDLTRLRVLDLSYNRISRIGHGKFHITPFSDIFYPRAMNGMAGPTKKTMKLFKPPEETPSNSLCLSSCTLIKELYLAGNKISDVEGLHRLLKLTVVDLSFNKITTAKALGQLVANYNTLLALNLLGNPIQNNIGDDHLRKVVTGLLPKLTYLNKQPIKPQRARAAAMDSVAKAALGSNGWTSRRKMQKRASPRTPSGAKSNLGGRKGGHRSKS